MPEPTLAPRLLSLPRARLLDREVPVAVGFRARLLGLAYLDRDEAGPGLLILRCASVHTFGMRFPLDVLFLDPGNAVVEIRRQVPPHSLVFNRDAAAVLEIPSDRGARR